MAVQQTEADNRLLKQLVLLVLLSTMAINLLSAYIRHLESGLGCDDWPACYGVVGDYVSPEGQSVVGMALAPVEVAKKIHRVVATVLVIMVLLMLQQFRKQTRLPGVNRSLPYVLVAILLLLSVVGPASYLKTLPAIAVVNLLGGMALMAVCWWLWLQLQGGAAAGSASLKTLARVALGMLLVQLGLGAWLSANFAAVSCSGVLGCGPETGGPGGGAAGFWYFRELALDEAGRVVQDQSMRWIHIAHRIGAALCGLVLLMLAMAALRLGGSLRRSAMTLLMLVLVQLLLGAAAVSLQLPLALVLAHNLTAALLLLAVLKLNYLAQ